MNVVKKAYNRWRRRQSGSWDVGWESTWRQPVTGCHLVREELQRDRPHAAAVWIIQPQVRRNLEDTNQQNDKHSGSLQASRFTSRGNAI